VKGIVYKHLHVHELSLQSLSRTLYSQRLRSSFVDISMALLRADLHSVPVTFPLGDDGLAIVTSTMLSLRFQFREEALYVEEEVFDSESRSLLHAICQLPSRNDEGMFWLFKPGKYRAYGLPILAPSAKLLTP